MKVKGKLSITSLKFPVGLYALTQSVDTTLYEYGNF